MDQQAYNKPLKRLQWRLTLSYTSVTMGSLIVIVIVLAYLLFSNVLVPYHILDTALSPEAWIEVASKTSSEKWQYILSRDPIDSELVSLTLQDGDFQITYFDLLQIGDLQLRARTLAEGTVVIVDPGGMVLGVSNSSLVSKDQVGKSLDLTLLPGLDDVMQAAFSGDVDPQRLFVTIIPYEQFYFAVPYFSEESGDILAVSILYFDDLPTENDLPTNVLSSLGKIVGLLLLAAGVIGTIFGAVTARGISRRLGRVSGVIEAWSRGDFSKFIDDSLGDEITQLASQLNHMAEQLEELLVKRQQMAVSEERNRLARDLHDSAKQEALAASFQLGTALTYLEQNPQKAKKHLQEAEYLVDSVREELAALIHELRPTVVNGAAFEDVIRELLTEWSHQTDIEVDLSQSGQVELSLEQKHTLYRVIKESLANIARHSQAARVEVKISCGEGVCKLSVVDDGIGFDLDLPWEGFGLQSMRERIESLRGILWVESTPGKGTHIQARFPIDNEEDFDGRKNLRPDCG